MPSQKFSSRKKVSSKSKGAKVKDMPMHPPAVSLPPQANATPNIPEGANPPPFGKVPPATPSLPEQAVAPPFRGGVIEPELSPVVDGCSSCGGRDKDFGNCQFLFSGNLLIGGQWQYVHDREFTLPHVEESEKCEKAQDFAKKRKNDVLGQLGASDWKDPKMEFKQKI